MDIGRFVSGGYIDDCMAYYHKGEGYFGNINECIYGEQCGSHACYCTNPYSPYRKCFKGWYTGGKTRDCDCEYFDENPYFIAVYDEYGLDPYESQIKTFENLKRLGLTKEIKEDE